DQVGIYSPGSKEPAQGHRRLRFSSPLNNVKEQNSPPQDEEENLKPSQSPKALRILKAPSGQPLSGRRR
ncbi:hypothetical protein, partial [Microvirga lupini]|uniref:hypothetical protein n=1 Tax=Microvirga lupini TaxID=420324 RepID=UPI001AEED9E2